MRECKRNKKELKRREREEETGGERGVWVCVCEREGGVCEREREVYVCVREREGGVCVKERERVVCAV